MILTEEYRYKTDYGTSQSLIEISLESKALSELSISKIQNAVKKGLPLDLYGVTAYVEDYRCPDTLVCKTIINGKPYYASIITGQLFTEEGKCKTGYGITIRPGSRKKIGKKEATKWINEAGKENSNEYGRTSYYMLTNSSKTA